MTNYNNYMQQLKDFTNLYQVSKTLRFELIPQGKTKETFAKWIAELESNSQSENNLLKVDKQRADNYKIIKALIDLYHREFIEECLKGFMFEAHKKIENNIEREINLLEAFEEEFWKTDEGKIKKKRMESDVSENIWADGLRSQVSKVFKNNTKFVFFDKTKLFKDSEHPELTINFWYDKNKDYIIPIIQDLFPKRKINDEIISEVIISYNRFFSSIKTFCENRKKNIYTEKAKAGAISYRVIDENLPKFIINKKIAETISINVPTINETVLRFNSLTNIDSYNLYLTQTGIDEYNKIVGEVNSFTNFYNQKQKDKKDKLPKLKSLFKQILSEKERRKLFESDADLIKGINEAISFIKNYEMDNIKINILDKAFTLFENLKDFDTEKIFIRNDSFLTDLSIQLCKFYKIDVEQKWNKIHFALNNYYEKIKNPLSEKQEVTKKYIEEKEKWLKTKEFSLTQIQNALAIDSDFEKIEFPIENYLKTNSYIKELRKKDNSIQEVVINFYKVVKTKEQELKEILNKTEKKPNEKLLYRKPYGKEYIEEVDDIEKIKDYLDAYNDWIKYFKILLPKSKEIDKDERFYTEYENCIEAFKLIECLYNQTRNYLTQKPYSLNKMPLYLKNNGKLLDGFVESNGSTQFGAYLFRKKVELRGLNSFDYEYYLGISNDDSLFSSESIIKLEKKYIYERLYYYQFKSTSFYGSSYQGYFGHYYTEDKNQFTKLIEDIIVKYGNEELKAEVGNIKKEEKTPNRLIKLIAEKDLNCKNLLEKNDGYNEIQAKLISRFKELLQHKYINKVPKAKQIIQKDYHSIIDIMDDIECFKEAPQWSYKEVNDEEFNNAINSEEKPLFLFKISNKDLSFIESFNAGKRKIENKGKDNLHTIYFKELMSGLQNSIDIGTGKLFLRPSSIPVNITHPKDNYIAKKNKKLRDEKSFFKYDIIKDKRFTEYKFQLHLSISLNHNPLKKEKPLNEKVLEHIKQSQDIKIIGIDRGERHLLYLTIIDQEGKILKQESLNTVISTYTNNHEKIEYPFDYQDKLVEMEKHRLQARQNWEVIGNIKEMKEGYMSQIVHKIVKMMVEENAILVLEQLNKGFKNSRKKIERQVYDKFEIDLMNKLRYLTFKDNDSKDTGGVLNGLQMVNEKDFNGTQNGFLFYVPAWNTSKMDPVTGFVNLFDTHYESIEKAKTFFKQFKSISFNSSKNYFEFDFDYNHFTKKAEGTKTNWTICTHSSRIETYRNINKNSQWDNREIVLTDSFIELFNKYGINYQGNLINDIAKQSEKAFFERLLYLFKLTLQMRNSITGTETDYLISPVANNKGEFYDSRKADKKLPDNADANGAYNIARKGLWVIEQIKQAKDLKKLKLAISNKEWLHFAQQQPNKAKLC